MASSQTGKQHSPTMVNRRRKPRTSARGLVILSWGDGEERVGAGVVLDRSARGMRIRHDLPLLLGDTVRVVIPEQTVLAQVVWVADLSGSREAGLRLLGIATDLPFRLWPSNPSPPTINTSSSSLTKSSANTGDST